MHTNTDRESVSSGYCANSKRRSPTAGPWGTSVWPYAQSWKDTYAYTCTQWYAHWYICTSKDTNKSTCVSSSARERAQIHLTLKRRFDIHMFAHPKGAAELDKFRSATLDESNLQEYSKVGFEKSVLNFRIMFCAHAEMGPSSAVIVWFTELPSRQNSQTKMAALVRNNPEMFQPITVCFDHLGLRTWCANLRIVDNRIQSVKLTIPSCALSTTTDWICGSTMRTNSHTELNRI